MKVLNSLSIYKTQALIKKCPSESGIFQDKLKNQTWKKKWSSSFPLTFSPPPPPSFNLPNLNWVSFQGSCGKTLLQQSSQASTGSNQSCEAFYPRRLNGWNHQPKPSIFGFQPLVFGGVVCCCFLTEKQFFGKQHCKWLNHFWFFMWAMVNIYCPQGVRGSI